MINQSMGSKIFKFRGLHGIRKNHENLLPSKIPCLTVLKIVEEI